MPKHIRHIHEDDDELQGFCWDGERIDEFLKFHPVNFCYHVDTKSLIIDSHQINVGDWIIHEDDHIIFMTSDEFEKEFDLV